MGHLPPADLLDIAEGTRHEATCPHLEGCAACRRQVVMLRSTLATAAAVDVPEPSPLFWDHLSARVREAVAAQDTAPASGWRFGWASWRLRVHVSAALVALAVAVAAWKGQGVTQRSAMPVEASDEAGDAWGDPVVSMGDDPSLSLLADLTGDLDWDAAAEAGITARGGAADRALAELTDGERAEVRRLLNEEMAVSGA